MYSSSISAWFGDLKDGTHDGTYKDPRMALIEIKSKYIVRFCRLWSQILISSVLLEERRFKSWIPERSWSGKSSKDYRHGAKSVQETLADISQAALTGSVAQTGLHREFSESDIQKERT